MDAEFELECLDERENDGVDVSVLEDRDEEVIDKVLTPVPVIAIDAVTVDEITMEDDFFDVTVIDDETLGDDDIEAHKDDDSDTEEDNVTSSDG